MRRPPAFVEPMQAKLVAALPEGSRWLYEPKLDGYRAIAIKNGDAIAIRSRNGKDLTAAYPAVTAAVKKLKAKSAVLDGEIVAVDSSGVPSFQALQHRSARTDHQIAYYAFDLLHLDGVDRLELPLDERRALLPQVLGNSGVLQSIELPGSAADVIAAVSALGLEGVVAKKRDSKYEPGLRSGAWLKLKLDRQQEFVVGGFRPNVRTVDALLVGYYEGRSLQFAGKVRAGMTPRIRAQLFDLLKPRETARCPFANLPNSKSSHWGAGVTAGEMREMTWVEPTVVVQIRFVEWTAEANLRHASFMGLRTDKPPKAVRREVT
ncbi:MAG TPA: non-homologous end-joining DNA ligase [Vicinamibacterales bacterium]